MKRRLWIVLGVTVLLTVVLEWTFRHTIHAEFSWHLWPAFDFVYGFVSCAAIVLLSKWAGKRFLQKRPDYYD